MTTPDRFEINFTIDPELNYQYEIDSLLLADKMVIEAAETGKKGVMFSQVYVSSTLKKACVTGRFISYEASLEIAKVMEKHGYETDVTP